MQKVALFISMEERRYDSGRVDVCRISVMLLVLIWASPVLAGISLSYSNGLLSADITDATLHAVLQELSAEYGMVVLVDKAIEDAPVKTAFVGLPIEKAIKRVVHPFSSAMIFSHRLDAGGVEELFISELKVFESNTGKPSQYVQIALPEHQNLHPSTSGAGRPITEGYRNPFHLAPNSRGIYGSNTYSGRAQRGIRDSRIRLQIEKIQYLRAKGDRVEIELRKEISGLRLLLADQKNRSERKALLSDLMDKARELDTTQSRNRNRIHYEERRLRQMQMQ